MEKVQERPDEEGGENPVGFEPDITEDDERDLDAAVQGCPGWDLRQLAGHMGHIHRWSRLCLLLAENPQVAAFVEPGPDASGDDLAAWLEQGGVLHDPVYAALYAAEPCHASCVAVSGRPITPGRTMN